MKKRAKHSNKDIETTLRELEALGWIVEKAKGKSSHSWGFILCPWNAEDCRDRQFCRMSVWSTPRNPAQHAAALLSKAAHCVKESQDEDEDEDEDANTE